MIDLWEVILISSGLALDVFAYSLWRGATVAKLYKRDVLKMMLIFTGFQTGSIVLGRVIMHFSLSQKYRESMNQLWIIAAALIFFAIGIYMIIRALLKRKEVLLERGEGAINYRTVLFWAAMTSLDGILAGISFGILPVPILMLCIVTLVATLIAVFLGLMIGYWMGGTIKNYMVLVGGLVLILGGVDVLSHYFVRW